MITSDNRGVLYIKLITLGGNAAILTSRTRCSHEMTLYIAEMQSDVSGSTSKIPALEFVWHCCTNVVSNCLRGVCDRYIEQRSDADQKASVCDPCQRLLHYGLIRFVHLPATSYSLT